MNLKPKLIIAIVAALGCAGCGSTSIETSATRNANRDAETSGSPYRYHVRNSAGGKIIEKYRVVPPRTVTVPGNLEHTSADARLQINILAEIARLQRNWGDTTPPTLLGVQPLEKTADSIKEIWFIQNRDGTRQYEVVLSRQSDSVGFTVMTP